MQDRGLEILIAVPQIQCTTCQLALVSRPLASAPQRATQNGCSDAQYADGARCGP